MQDKLERWDQKLEKYCGVDFYKLLVFVEIGLQVFQFYKLSHLVATRWINRLMVLVVVINCWFIPIVYVVFRNKMPSFVKVVHLMLDVVLEIVYGMVILFAIFYPYYRDAIHILYDTPYVNFYMDTWFVDAVVENRQIYVTSWIDFCSKMAPGGSLFLRLHAHQPHYKKRIVNGVMPALGLGVLVLHLAADAVGRNGTDPGYLLEITPLSSTQYSCAVFEVSCTQKHITGSKSDLKHALHNIDPLGVQGLIFFHCEALSIPPRLRDFSNLIEVKIHNCSLSEWGDDAAVTEQAHPALQSLNITMINMSGIPEGVLSPDFPPSLNDSLSCCTRFNCSGYEGEHYLVIPRTVDFAQSPTTRLCANDPGVRNFVIAYNQTVEY